MVKKAFSAGVEKDASISSKACFKSFFEGEANITSQNPFSLRCFAASFEVWETLFTQGKEKSRFKSSLESNGSFILIVN